MLKFAPSAVKPEPRQVDYRLVPFGGGTKPNVKQISALYTELFPRSPLSKIGARFLEHFYFDCLPRQGEIFGAVAYVSGSPAGFVAATYDSNGFIRRSLFRNFTEIAWILGTSFPTPRRIGGLLEASGIMGSRSGKVPAGRSEHVGEVLSIGVRKSFRSAGFQAETGLNIGRDLMLGVLEGFEKSKIERARLVLDSNDLQTQAFCTKLGWIPRKRSVHGLLLPSTEFVWIPGNSPHEKK